MTSPTLVERRDEESSMTNKLPGRNPHGQTDSGPSDQDLHTAYQVHTLAQMLYGQMAATYPWILGPPQTPFMPMAGPTGQAAMGPPFFGPAVSPPMAAPWMQGWAGAWGLPAGNTMGFPWAGCCFGSECIPR